MKGDRVEIVVDVGGGTQTFVIEATRAGRRVEVTSGRGILEVAEVTRTGRPVRTGRFMASRVVAVVEHPATDPESDEPTEAARHRRKRRSVRAGSEQPTLL